MFTAVTHWESKLCRLLTWCTRGLRHSCVISARNALLCEKLLQPAVFTQNNVMLAQKHCVRGTLQCRKISDFSKFHAQKCVKSATHRTCSDKWSHGRRLSQLIYSVRQMVRTWGLATTFSTECDWYAWRWSYGNWLELCATSIRGIVHFWAASIMYCNINNMFIYS